ncbi:hypothetical protein GCM10009007_18760 [Formosimonas limnophila]|uniref:Phage tail lysozyme domain-containing protein n=2 Tax=Formosimonas limnophila TaxID=1384487 RepID=A0A8J3G0Q0_9BURK|nr:hypothetical protein GCM10009007_18760 [Formosimonas limnophila]
MAQGNLSNSDSTAYDKSQRLMTEMAADIKSMGSSLMQDNDELDPMIAGLSEVGQFLGAGKEALTPLGRGMAKVFAKQERMQAGWLNRIWQALTKSQTTQSEFSKAELKHLKAIENKPVAHAANTGLLSGLPSLSGMGGLASGGLKLFSKIPRIGKIAALAGLAFGAFSNDSEADEIDKPINKTKKTTGLIGGLAGGAGGLWAGAAAGAAIGSVIPVIGTAIGAIVGGAAGYFAGDSAGELIGHWLADVNWRDVGDNVSSTWQNATSNMSKVWDSAVASLTRAFGDWFKQAGQVFSQMGAQANDSLKQLTGVDVKGMASTASSFLGGLVGQAKQGYLGMTGQIGSQISGTRSAVGGVKDYGEFLASNLNGYSTEETRAFMNRMIHKENRGGQLDLQNKWGYTGLYQFGASALAQTGMIDRRKFDTAVLQNKGIANGSDIKAHKAFLADPSNWTVAGGLSAYRNSKALQDESMRRLIESNIKTGQKYHKGNKAAALGYAAAAHIGGAGRANKWYGQGIDSVDGNKTKTSSYAAWGEAALQGVYREQPLTQATPNTANRSNPATSNGEVVSKGFAFTQANNGIGYSAASHGSLAAGQVDCSQWVYELQTAVVSDMNRALGTRFDPKLLKKASTAAGQIQAVQKATGQMWANREINETLLKEGMLLGTSNGKKNQRFNDIDHIAQVTIDAVGKRWISESHGGKNDGVHQYAADKWLARQRKKGRAMYAVDPYLEGRQQPAHKVQSPTVTAGGIGAALGQTSGSTINASVPTQAAIPKANINVPKDIHEWLAQSGKKASSFDNAMKLNQNKPAPTAEPAFEMPLTQDVSDRDIARIVTGGIGGLAAKN